MGPAQQPRPAAAARAAPVPHSCVWRGATPLLALTVLAVVPIASVPASPVSPLVGFAAARPPARASAGCVPPVRATPLCAARGRRATLASLAGLGLLLGSTQQVPPVEAAGTGGAASAPTWASAASGALQGVAQNLVKQTILHPLDTVKTRLQVLYSGRDTAAAASAAFAGPLSRNELFQDLYRGFLPCIVSSTPGSATFFAVKEAVTREFAARAAPAPLPTVSGVVAGVLASKALRTPFDVAETRAMAAKPGSAAGAAAARPLDWDGSWGAVRAVLAAEGPMGLYRGYGANVGLKLPQDTAKFLAYEALRGTGGVGALPPGLAGSAASLFASAVTTPLDVLRTRVMVEEKPIPDNDMVGVFRRIAATGEYQQLWTGLGWRLARGVLAGAIQFSVLEETKNAIEGRR